MPNFIKNKHYWTAGLIAGLSCLAGSLSLPAYAEGSADLTGSGGNRPYLEYRNDTNGGILRRTVMKVYANEGETIDLGSSAVGIGNGRINYRDPSGVAGTCGGAGQIRNRAEEVAGPGDGTGGTFVPCTVTVGPGQTGIWEIDFVSPNQGSDSNPPPTAASATWGQQNTGMVSAWDITVRSAAGTKIPGRAYANYYAFNIGGNSRSLSSQFTVLTKEGYQYRIDLNGLDPYGFIFFANRNGFFENTSGDSIFRSLQFVGPNPGQLPAGYGFQNPNDPDVGIYITHKTFINPPDPSLPTSASSPQGPTWLLVPPVPPPIPSNFNFTGIEGTAGQAGTTPLGGTLSFDSTSQNAYAITIDLNQDGLYGTGNDRTFIGRSVVGSNSIFWDGLDGNGVSVQPSTVPYSTRINQYAGEAHFPVIDAEQNNVGLILERLNEPVGGSVSEDPFNIYYDDRNTGSAFTLCASGETGSDCYGGGPNPREALTGVNSSTGAHEFTSNFGNRRGIDTWVYYPSANVELVGGIVIKEADLIVDKTVDLAIANPGDALTYTITVTNDGPSDEPGIGFQDIVPSSLSSVSWTCAVTSGNGSCGEASGSGNNINTTLDLDNQAVATYTVTGILSSSASGSITNEATAIRNNDITDPDLSNNSDAVVTVLNTVPPPGGSICYAVADKVGGDDNADRLVRLDINTGTETALGQLGTRRVEAIAHWPITNTLYATDAGVLGTLNTSAGSGANNIFNAIGAAGSGSGSSGNKNFGDIDGLAFHPFTGELYGAVRDGDSSAPEDLLIKINPSTGAAVPDAFGPGQDYLVIRSAATTGFNDVDDLAFDPDTGFLYGVANQGSSNADSYIRIDTTDGSTTLVGAFGVRDLEGLTAFNDGSFYGVTGDRSPTSSDRDRFYSINKVSGTATEISELNVGSDYESVACLTGPPNRITGTVFVDDSPTNAALDGGEAGTATANVRLYRDSNGNGQVDSSDVFLVSQETAANGTFDFLFASNGAFVLDVDGATLPPANNVFTTDNLEAADFGISLNVTDANNDFGHFTDSNLALVKRITAVNGVSLTDSVDDLSDDNDNHPNWPIGTSGAGISTFLAGATQAVVDAGDEVEYTIYYLATGNFPVTNVDLCDRIPRATNYIPESMVIFTNGSTSNLTDTNTDGDGAEFLPVGDPTVLPCTETDTGGTVVVNLAQSPNQLPNATGPGTPTNAYGFIRFRVNVDESYIP